MVLWTFFVTNILDASTPETFLLVIVIPFVALVTFIIVRWNRT
jgi:hypothetical protein